MKKSLIHRILYSHKQEQVLVILIFLLLICIVWKFLKIVICNPVCYSTVPTGSRKSFFFNNFKTNTHTFMEMNVNLQCAKRRGLVLLHSHWPSIFTRKHSGCLAINSHQPCLSPKISSPDRWPLSSFSLFFF